MIKQGTFITLVRRYKVPGLIAFFKIKMGFTRNLKLEGLKYGIRLRPNSTDITAFKAIFLFGDYDIKMDSEPRVIVDAGANVGLASIYFANKYPSAKIIAIELDSDNFKLLNYNTANYPQIETIHAGVWYQNEILKFEKENIGHWAYKINNDTESVGEEVKSITMATIINKYKINQIDLFKVDIEGAEEELFTIGAKKWLPNVKQIVIEFHDRFKPGSSKKVRTALFDNGFAEKGEVGENVVFEKIKQP